MSRRIPFIDTNDSAKTVDAIMKTNCLNTLQRKNHHEIARLPGSFGLQAN
jgi:hypothetical protein